ncbi:FAD-dependent thymidylate synthase [bacterium]|nr:FAD-dependent thymidylate synthase [bacterium]MBU1637660.1 FAD-dependent thymidylate synthase [bacterium]
MAVSVRLAGYNLDADLLTQTTELLRMLKARAEASSSSSPTATDAREILELIQERISSDITIEAFTPETLSAAYARISRDPKHVTELRRAARVSVVRARKSNENIIFGLGHASVAEHAVFNFDISGISRLASEVLQSHRLLSFTEKSQRYVTIGEDYIVPPEALCGNLESAFREFIPELFAGYAEIYQALREQLLTGRSEHLKKAEISLVEGRAKEDARYLLPLACSTQMGVTMNARNAEHVIADFSDHPLAEIRALGAAIRKAIDGLAPSLVKYITRGDYPRKNHERLAELTAAAARSKNPEFFNGPSLRVIAATQEGEAVVLRALAFSHGGRLWQDTQQAIAAGESQKLWIELFRAIGPHDVLPREFELISITFEAEVSAACFGQLKRHRMMTLLHQQYIEADGAVIPPSIREAGLDEPFHKAIGKSVEMAKQMRGISPLLAPYLLTNAHRKRVVMQVNARELYHFARLRCDEHAQWEIRMLADMMIAEAMKFWPNVMKLACGKDRFPEVYRKTYGLPEARA